MKQFLPSLTRGVYRFNQQFYSYLSDADAVGFILTKKAFLPRHYLEAIEKLLDLSDDNDEADRLITDFRPLGNRPNGAGNIVRDFFSHHSCLSQENDNNYLERRFVEKILIRVFPGVNLIGIVNTQHPVANYRLDFAIFGEKNYAIEIDGFGKFKRRSDLDKFVNRQNDIIAKGWTLYRFSYADVVENTAITVQRITDIFREDTQLAPMLGNRQRQIDFSSDCNKSQICTLVDSFYAIQDLIFEKLIYSKESSRPAYIQENMGYEFSIAALAISDLYYYLDAISQVLDIEFRLPEIRLNGLLINKIKSFARHDDGFLHPKIKPSTSAKPTLVIDREVLQNTIYDLSYTYHPVSPVSFRDCRGNSIEKVRTKLAYFTKSIFGYDQIHFEQDQVLAKILAKQDVLGLLPTGSGKSFCFWLPALIKPGLTIIISPLKALMLDQDISLKLFGIYSTAFINSDVDNYQRQAIYTDIKLGRIRLLYISPERMEIKSFILELEEILEFVPINFLVIDEAHCVSEWGHDFRPAYLRIPHFAKSLREKNINPRMTIIALTATAGKTVKKDMMAILGLEDEHVVSAKSFDRANLSFQFVTVNNDTEKSNKYEETIKHYLPTAQSKKDIKNIFEPIDDNKASKGVGLVFCIYADSHGKHTINDSVAHYLRQSQKLIERNKQKTLDDFSVGSIRGFSSKVPTLCPKCFSSRYVSDSATPGQKVCTECGNKFPGVQAVKPNNWPKILRRNQEAFKAGEIDLMVATKGFGMGIDKGSVRFVVHTGLAGGMEGWYQEAGRAGRDGSHSHCISIVDVPTQECLSSMENNGNIPDCTKKNCPHGKNAICDYGKQHVFIQASYPSIEADTMAILRCLDDLIIQYDRWENNSILSANAENIKAKEMALYRLQLLGVIQDYYLDYSPWPNIHIEVLGLNLEIDQSVIRDRLYHYLRANWTQTKCSTNDEIEARVAQLTKGNIENIESRIDKEKTGSRFLNYEELNPYHSLYRLVMACSLAIVNHVYEDILGMRYGSLKDLLNFVRNTSSQCRRIFLLNQFDIEGVAGKNETTKAYECGFCDICLPDLKFPETGRAKPPEINESLNEIDRLFRDWLENDEMFNIEQAEYYIKTFVDYPIQTYSKAARILNTSDPSNLKALYIARYFCGRDDKFNYSRRLLEIANYMNILELDTIWRMYLSTEQAVKPQVFNVLCDELGMLLNSPQYELLLYREAEKLLDKNKLDKTTVELLGAGVIANDLKDIPISTHVAKLNSCIKAFTDDYR